jgi:hypothetical protein
MDGDELVPTMGAHLQNAGTVPPVQGGVNGDGGAVSGGTCGGREQQDMSRSAPGLVRSLERDDTLIGVLHRAQQQDVGSQEPPGSRSVRLRTEPQPEAPWSRPRRSGILAGAVQEGTGAPKLLTGNDLSGRSGAQYS